MTTRTEAISFPPVQVSPTYSTIFVMPDVDPAFSGVLAVPGAKVEAFCVEAVQAALAELGSAAGGETCAILWQYPAELIATALSAGLDPADVTEAWLGRARTMLELYRRNRRKLVLIDVRILDVASPDTGRVHLCDRLGLQTLLLPVQPKPTVPPRAPLPALLAALILPQLPALQACLEELLSASFSPQAEALSDAELANSVDLAALATEYARLEAVGSEVELLIAQVALQQKEVDQARVTSEEALARALADLRTEAEARAKLQEERDRLARDLKKYSLALDKVFASTSWKITKPLRKAKRLLFGGPLPMDEAIAAGKQCS